MIGIIQEQHPERTQLFMQWKEMKWPILVDSLNLLNVSAVPITALIDEKGIVRKLRAKPEDLDDFLNLPTEPPSSGRRAEHRGSAAPLEPLTADEFLKSAVDQEPERLGLAADAAFLWGRDRGHLSQAIDLYERRIELEPENGTAHFRAGVAFRARYDSGERREGDFTSAIREWGQALAIDPNQYIWRRRIQQYGPRLDKPYPFYDWVPRARAEIEARGEVPVALPIEPGGAEFADPIRSFKTAAALQEPDPGGRILRDDEKLILSEATVVPGSVRAGESARVHVVFRPDSARKAHWNNEVDDLIFWIAPPDGWQTDQRMVKVARPPTEVSEEPRTVEFEVQIPPDTAGPTRMDCYALYYVCEDVNGVCLYRRQDIPITFDIAPGG